MLFLSFKETLASTPVHFGDWVIGLWYMILLIILGISYNICLLIIKKKWLPTTKGYHIILLVPLGGRWVPPWWVPPENFYAFFTHNLIIKNNYLINGCRLIGHFTTDDVIGCKI